MKNFLLGFIFFCSAQSLIAQTDTAKQTTAADSVSTVFYNVDIQAKFPGGPEAWSEFLSKNLKTNTPIKKKAPPGNYTVQVSFMVDTTGKVSDVRIDKDPGYGCGDDVYRIFTKKTPHWLPAVKDGRKVIYRQRQVITYVVD
ncbi:energy transducer TonB [Foetidibacter luteolus]|uniref:energy transducer TonB n=1 Tax=Foetidibacter luteolus TaxID=2608880 RepID=UPI00129B9D95|nr:energy transducer TonB [Foetidibacter luteolus]